MSTPDKMIGDAMSVNRPSRPSVDELDSFLGSANAIEFPISRQPQVSLIVLCFNKAEFTLRCLRSIATHAKGSYEVIIVNNGSTDRTTELLARLRGTVNISCGTNLYFGGGNNVGFAAAKGEFVLFLNNDTEFSMDVVQPLVATMQLHQKVGAAGVALVHPDGKLQEAGSIIWRDGTCFGYGRGDNPNRSEYFHRREVDFCSAACLMVRRKQIPGGLAFDPIYEPAYYEDADLCMRFRINGYRVVVEPRARIIHHEYTSSSPEAATALMRRNHRTFMERWNDVLARQHLPANAGALRGRDRSRAPTLLIIDDRIPNPDGGRGYPRAFELVRTLARRFKITYYPNMDNTPREPWTGRLQSLGVECIVDGRSLEALLAARPDHYALAIVSRPHNMGQSLRALREFEPNTRLIYDAEALFFARDQKRRELLELPLDDEFERARRGEVALLARAHKVIVVSEQERQAIIAVRPALAAKVHVWGHPQSVRPTRTLFSARRDMLFVGAFEEGSPNDDAVLYFVREILPLIRKSHDIRLLVAGGNPPEAILGSADAGVEALGFVPDLDPLYEHCRVFVVPHRFAGGIPLKLIDAMARGIPAVVSSLIAEQMPDISGTVLVGSTNQEFADQIIAVHTDEALWERLRLHSIEYIQKWHSPEKLEQQLIGIVANSISTY